MVSAPAICTRVSRSVTDGVIEMSFAQVVMQMGSGLSDGECAPLATDRLIWHPLYS